MKPNHTVLTLDNGIRIVHKRVKHSRLVHVGLMIDTGSRDENEKNSGIAHFIEHSVFKGTEKRNSYHILNRLESVGGDLNAYTTREKTCFYASCLKKYADRSVDLLFDIIFNSKFTEKDLEKEKRVILEEIEMYEDSPEDSIYDDFFQHVYPNHPLGYNILGTRETVKGFKRQDIIDFIQSNYSNNRIVLSVVGNISEQRIEQIARKYLQHLELSHTGTERTAPQPHDKFNLKVEKEFQQSHCIIGGNVYSKRDPKRHGLILLNNLLGGNGMSSRLNMSIREKYGYTYNISSSYAAYTDAGVLAIYMGTDETYLQRCIDLTMKELKLLRNKKLGTLQLQKAKNQLMGQVAMIEENHAIIMQSQAKSLLDYDKVISLDEFFKNIEKVTSEEIIEIANEVFDEDKLNILTYTTKP